MLNSGDLFVQRTFSVTFFLARDYHLEGILLSEWVWLHNNNSLKNQANSLKRLKQPTHVRGVGECIVKCYQQHLKVSEI